MKIALATILIAGFAGIAVFGIFAMNMNMEGHGHSGCVAATASGANCPDESDVISFLNFHFDSFRSFSTATFASTVSGLLLVLLLLIIGMGTIAGRPTSLQQNFEYVQCGSDIISSLPKRKLTHWLSLLEHSPEIS